MAEFQDQLDAMLREEAQLQFAAFTNETALRLGLLLAEVAKREGKSIAIDIARNGQTLFHYALPGTSADNDAWIERKKRVVDRYGHSSFYVGTLCKSQGVAFEEKSRLDPDRYAAAGGCFPVIVRNVGPVGTVTVSGLPQAEDHALVVRVLREFLAGGGDR